GVENDISPPVLVEPAPRHAREIERIPRELLIDSAPLLGKAREPVHRELRREDLVAGVHRCAPWLLVCERAAAVALLIEVVEVQHGSQNRVAEILLLRWRGGVGAGRPYVQEAGQEHAMRRHLADEAVAIVEAMLLRSQM